MREEGFGDGNGFGCVAGSDNLGIHDGVFFLGLVPSFLEYGRHCGGLRGSSASL